MIFELPKLKYAYNDLEPFIDTQTVEIHYTKHHQTYITNLNKALEGQPEFADWDIEKLLKQINMLPENIRTVVQNNGGGYSNHNLYWATMAKTPQTEPTGILAEKINMDLGGLSEVKNKMNDAGLKRFGSGWAWLVLNQSTKLEVYSTPNQDSPIMKGDKPLLGVDVWEHAYYLKYQNRRNEYLENWWKVVDWKAVEEQFAHLQ
jgi:superoxide dismutase, Fe-Mn family